MIQEVEPVPVTTSLLPVPTHHVEKRIVIPVANTIAKRVPHTTSEQPLGLAPFRSERERPMIEARLVCRVQYPSAACRVTNLEREEPDEDDLGSDDTLLFSILSSLSSNITLSHSTSFSNFLPLFFFLCFIPIGEATQIKTKYDLKNQILSPHS